MQKTLLLGFVLFLAACNEYSFQLEVLDQGVFELKTKDGNYLRFPSGDYTAVIKLAKNSEEASELHLESGVKLELYLPAAKELLNSFDPIEVPADELGQDFSLIISRDVSLDEDRFTLSFFEPDQGNVLAVGRFFAEGKDQAYDSEEMEFLRSFQKVKKSHRAAVFFIDYTLDNYGWKFGEVLDGLAHFSSQLLLAPWVYGRYSSVVWVMGDKVSDLEYVNRRWEEVVEKRAVVDIFSFLHGGGIYSPMYSMRKHRPWKEHQLRLVYREGCGTKGGGDLIESFGVTSTTGYRDNSVSPLYSFAFVRNWAYGKNLEKALIAADKSGDRNVSILGYDFLSGLWIKAYNRNPWEDEEDMYYQTEPMTAWTEEIPPHKLIIDRSAVPNRKTYRVREASAAELRETRVILLAGMGF